MEIDLYSDPLPLSYRDLIDNLGHRLLHTWHESRLLEKQVVEKESKRSNIWVDNYIWRIITNDFTQSCTHIDWLVACIVMSRFFFC